MNSFSSLFFFGLFVCLLIFERPVEEQKNQDKQKRERKETKKKKKKIRTAF